MTFIGLKFIFLTFLAQNLKRATNLIDSLPLPQDSNDKSGHLAKLFLRDTQMQSFMYKPTNQWGPSIPCNMTGTFHDETGPIAVGTSLLFAVGVTVVGYAVWRHFRNKKIVYGNMQ